jgi:ribonuclease BN (tRNA processing enzyme)
VKVTVLGSGGALADVNRARSCYLVEDKGKAILLDLGYGAFKNLRTVLDPEKINAVLFTHVVHPDHVADLIALLDYRYSYTKYRDGSKEQLNIFGPSGTSFLLEKIQEMFPHFADMGFKVKVEEMRYGKKNLFGLNITSKPVKHVENSIGFRVESDKKVVAYTGDSAFCEQLIDLGKEAGLFVMHCNHKTQKSEFQLNAVQCGEIAQKAGAKSIILSHLGFEPEKGMVELAAKSFKGKIYLAKDLMQVEV